MALTVSLEDARKHWGHSIVIAFYNDEGGTPMNCAIECDDCFDVLADVEL